MFTSGKVVFKTGLTGFENIIWNSRFSNTHSSNSLFLLKVIDNYNWILYNWRFCFQVKWAFSIFTSSLSSIGPTQNTDCTTPTDLWSTLSVTKTKTFSSTIVFLSIKYRGSRLMWSLWDRVKEITLAKW